MILGTPAARRTGAWSLLLALLPLCLIAPDAAAQFELEAAVLSETGASSQAGGTTLETSGGQAIIGVSSTQSIDLGLGYIYVTSPSSDTMPPLLRLDYPGTSGLGVEQAIGGVVNVRGAVSDASAVSWTLEAAPGASATGGFTTIASGAGNLSGLIAAWNTTSLSGSQTLRLRAVDTFGNAASATATVFVGTPVFTFAIGRKDSDAIISMLKGPTGIAVRSDGAIWVASTENDKILLISPAGVLLGEAGHAPGQSGMAKENGKKVNKFNFASCLGSATGGHIYGASVTTALGAMCCKTP